MFNTLTLLNTSLSRKLLSNLYRTLCYLLHQTHSGIFRHYLLYSAPLVTPANSQHCHTLRPRIFRTRRLFKTLWNGDQTYLESCHWALFSHIQAYSEPGAMLAYAETWYIRNPGIFRRFHNGIPMHIQNPVIFNENDIYEYSEFWHI